MGICDFDLSVKTIEQWSKDCQTFAPLLCAGPWFGLLRHGPGLPLRFEVVLFTGRFCDWLPFEVSSVRDGDKPLRTGAR